MKGLEDGTFRCLKCYLVQTWVTKVTQPAAQNKTAGTVSEGPLMDKPVERDRDAFTRHQTIERYRRLLTTIADRNHRKRLLELIAEEQQKQRDARDPKYLY